MWLEFKGEIIIEELLKEVQKEFDRLKARNQRLASTITQVKDITNDDNMIDSDKVRVIRNFVEEFIERFM